ncbi:MAG: LysM peptidoglycan-binding domain-containing protein [Chloroflexi bacterium]|nr:LysM peptidoglycan-binding domain-containing protein [Chloroflexota bacterium]
MERLRGYDARWLMVALILGLFVGSVGFVSRGAPRAEIAAIDPSVGADSTLVAVGEPQRLITHVARAGETVSSVAERYGITANTIRWANGLDQGAEDLAPGTRLTILPLSGVLHVVHEGETVDALAARYESLPEAIRSANGLAAGAELAVGSTLLVPGGRPARALARAAEPRFQPSFRGVARPVAEGVFAAAVPSAMPSPVAAPQATPAPAATPARAAEPTPITRTYAVVAGDTLRSIAARFGVSTEALIASNDLASADLLSIGQDVLIPAQDGVVYAVREGDTLIGLAERFGAGAADIVRANGLTNADLLPVGQHVLIPGSAVAERVAEQRLAPVRLAGRAALSSRGGARRYTVQAGDTLGDIAERFGLASSRVIGEANGMVLPYVLQIGQELAIPAGGGVPARAAAPARPAPLPPSAVGGSVVAYARQFVGYPYVFGGTTPRGFDCSGFVWYVFRNMDRPIPRDLYGQWQSGAPVSYANLAPGDIVFFSNTYMPGLSHNGIYIGGGLFVNAQSESYGVRITSMAEAYWAKRYSGARRVP